MRHSCTLPRPLGVIWLPDMVFSIKIDEDLPERLRTELAHAGYPAETVRDEGLTGAKDRRLWNVVQEEGRYFITADKEFGDVRLFPPGSHAGVLLLRTDHESSLQYVRLLRAVLTRYRLSALARCLTVSTDQGVRVRYPLATTD